MQKPDRKAELTHSQKQYVLDLLVKWRKTNINCFNRGTDKPTKKKLAEEIATINEILGVIKKWE
jgi:hypothetical protein